jgi:hypothetical protein
MIVSLKPGVSVAGVRPEIAIAITVAASIYAKYELGCVVTSIVDGKHSHGSIHYSGGACDLRTRHVPKALRATIANELREALGSDYDVVLEGDHIHVEFQPKGPR